MTLTSNRDAIAEILEGLARQQPIIGWDAHFARGRLWRGADTLRWCDEYEGVNDCDADAALDALAEQYGEQLDTIRGMLTRWARDGMRKPAQFRKALEETLS